jgi:hypothetical protein
MPRLVLRQEWCDERNLRSRLLAGRVVFESEGTLRKDRLDLKGPLRNTRVYAIVSQRAHASWCNWSRRLGISSCAGWRFAPR